MGQDSRTGASRHLQGTAAVQGATGGLLPSYCKPSSLDCPTAGVARGCSAGGRWQEQIGLRRAAQLWPPTARLPKPSTCGMLGLRKASPRITLSQRRVKGQKSPPEERPLHELTWASNHGDRNPCP